MNNYQFSNFLILSNKMFIIIGQFTHNQNFNMKILLFIITILDFLSKYH